MGTSCAFSVRRCAVTTTSSMAVADVADESAGEAANATAPACAPQDRAHGAHDVLVHSHW
jgi:hypothetical protein